MEYVMDPWWKTEPDWAADESAEDRYDWEDDDE